MGSGDEVMGPAVVLLKQNGKRALAFRIALMGGAPSEARTGVVDAVHFLVDGKKRSVPATSEALGGDASAKTGALFFVGRRNVFVFPPTKLWRELQKAKRVEVRFDPHGAEVDFKDAIRGVTLAESCKELRR